MNAIASLADLSSASPISNDRDPDAKTVLHDDGSPSTAHLKRPDPYEVAKLKRWAGSVNIIFEEDENGEPEIAASELERLGQTVKREFDIDLNSCAEWKDEGKKAMDMATQNVQPKQYPWPRAANVIWPLMTSAAFQFAARAYPAIVPGPSVVKGVVIGSDKGVPAVGPDGNQATDPATGQPAWKTGQDGQPQAPGAKQDRADRIGDHMSYQLLDEQTEWEPETDAMLHRLPIIGCAFRKSFFDPKLKHNSSLVVAAENLVINYRARSLERAPRVTEIVSLYPLEIKENELAGVFRLIVYTQQPAMEGQGSSGPDSDAPIEFLEQHRWWDFDGDGYPEPYIVTADRFSGQVVRIVARYEVDGIIWNYTKGMIVKIDPVHYYTKYDFFPNIEGGIYGMGFGHLLRSLNESINTTLNMMLDAGHMQVVGGGFIGKGLSMSAGSLRFQPQEWKPVNAVGGVIRDNIVPLPAPGPSDVLFQLLGLLIEAGKDVAGVKDILTGEAMAANTPATTMLAMIEQGLKGFTAIYKRIHRSLKAELAKLYRLNGLYLDQDAQYKVGDEWRTVSQADYQKGSGVEPISDPTMVTDMQKLGRANLLLEFKDDSWMNGQKIRKRVLEAANVGKVDELFNANPPPNPAIVKAGLELELKKQELEVRQAHEEASLQLRARHDAALIEKEQANALLARAQAINQVAQAEKAAQQSGVMWADHMLEAIRVQLDAMGNSTTDTTAANIEPSTTTPGTPEAQPAAEAPQ